MNVIDRSLSFTITDTSKWVKGAFFIYLFFALFGTMMPFQGSLQERAAEDAIGSSNMINQLLSLAYLIGLVGLWGKVDAVFSIIKKEKFLTIFLIWTFCSVFWSEYPMVSLKRWIALFGEAILCMSVLLHVRWSEEILRFFRILLFVYLPLTILSVLFIPEAVQYDNNSWRGLAITKNSLGQIALFSVIIWLSVISYHRKQAINIVHYGMLGLALLCLFGSRSTTSLLVGAFLFVIVALHFIGRNITHASLAHYYASIVILASTFLFAFVTVVAPEVLATFVGLFGKDLTFTGRIDLWARVFDLTQDRLLLGWGLGGFWVMDSIHLIPIFNEFVWIPNQAHQGYLDILNQTGLVGFSLLLLMAVSFVLKLSYLEKRQIWKWFFLGILFYNFQESLFFRPRHISHFMFIFAYLAFYTDLYKESTMNKAYLPVLYSTATR